MSTQGGLVGTGIDEDRFYAEPPKDAQSVS
jgi:hypothetical protein